MIKNRGLGLIVFSLLCAAQPLSECSAQNYTGERLTRGMSGVPSDNGMYLSWRMFVSDDSETTFDIYRESPGEGVVKLNYEPIKSTSDFTDATADLSRDNVWILKSGNREVGRFSRKGGSKIEPFMRLPIDRPEGGVVEGQNYEYLANDCSVGDLDGDGQYEIVLKWYPTNSKTPVQRGFTGNTFIDAYKLDGTRLWRIDLGKNIRSGAATTNFLVFDFDGDGCAELCCKTGDGTVDGVGRAIGRADADWRNYDKDSPLYGKIVEGPEYITVFDGKDGRAVATREYIPTRYPLDGWGGIGGNCGNDNTGGRSDRFTAAVAFLDGKTPSPVMVRGWYGRTVVASWVFDGDSLRNCWTFDSSLPGLEAYSGMGNHNLAVSDFDNDGFDEICVGAMTVDHDGHGLYSTGLRHGDAIHAGDLVPSRKGLEIFGVHENEGNNPIVKRTPAMAMFDAANGEIIWQDDMGKDAGRGVAADIDPRYEGAECWTNRPGLRRGDTRELISQNKPSSCNFVLYWDADTLSELLDHVTVSKWNWDTESTDIIFKAEGVVSNNGTKGNPCLTCDLFGDWREEIIWASDNQKELHIYMSAIPAVDRRPTLMQDRQYRLSVALQNVAYNQPPHLSFRVAESKF